jgi:hypothetical protein
MSRNVTGGAAGVNGAATRFKVADGSHAIQLQTGKH